MTHLERIRRSRFLSVRALALKAKVKPNTIADIEKGKTTLPRPETMQKIADALGVNVDELADAALFRVA